MQTFKTHDALNIRHEAYRCQIDPNRGTVVLLGGRSEFIEKYRETVEDLLKRDLDVFTFDWRGQGLSDRLLPNRHKGHVESYDDYLKDLEYFMGTVVLPGGTRPVFILAHSMGAHITLRYLHDHPGVVDRAVLTAPLIDIAWPAYLKHVMKGLANLMSATGFKKKYATRAMDFDPSRRRFQGNRLTRDAQRFQQTIDLIVENPKVAVGGVTFGWLAATFASIQLVMAENYCQNIETPILIISAGADRIVSRGAQEVVCQRLPDCRLVTISGSRHELLIETDAVRGQIWELFEDFVLNPGKN